MNHVNRADRSSTSRPAGFEELEGRRLLSASAVLGSDGIVRVEGTPRNDDIVIAQHIGKGSRLRVDVSRNGTPLGTFLRSQVKGVRALGGQGNDSIVVENGVSLVTSGGAATGGGATVTLDGSVSGQLQLLSPSVTVGQVVQYVGPLTSPVTLFGGGGNDSLTGGGGDDRLEGGSGDDVLFGEGGDDVLLGQNDDDSLRGGDGTDTLNGGDGEDDLDGDASQPRLILFGGGGGRVDVGTLTIADAAARTVAFVRDVGISLAVGDVRDEHRIV
jgi:hypothetical protein